MSKSAGQKQPPSSAYEGSAEQMPTGRIDTEMGNTASTVREPLYAGTSRPLAHETSLPLRRLRWAFGLTALNFAIAVIGAIASNSLALAADAGHTLTDLFAVALAYGAIRICEAPPTDRATFGFHRAEVLAAFLNGATLIAVFGWLVLSAIGRLTQPSEIRTLPMLGFAIAALVSSLAAALFLSGKRELREDINVRGAYLHLLGDATASIAVVAGAVVAFLSGARFVDPVLTFILSALILVSAVRLLRNATDVLLERPPRDVDVAEVESLLLEESGVSEVHDLHVWSLCPNLHALSAHLVVTLNHVRETVALRKTLAGKLKNRFRIAHSTFQFEPQVPVQGPLNVQSEPRSPQEEEQDCDCGARTAADY